MTDYIEDSLDRLEEEEERSWDWHEAAAVLSARSSEKSRQAAAQSQNGTAAPETAAVRERRREREPDLPASARSAAGGTQEPAESGTEWSGLEGTAPPGQPAAAGLYWGLARLRAAAAYGTSAPGRTVVRVPALTSEETPGLRPAELDRLFQRDARRYDGRFTLF